jgi:hypothetical protein
VKTSEYVERNISSSIVASIVRCTPSGGPDVGEVHVAAVRSDADRLAHEVDVHATRERVGDDERRRGEVVRLHLGMDPRLEVPVAGEHGADHEVALGHAVRDRLGQRARVPDARREPYPTVWKPSASRCGVRPAFS